MYLKLRVHGQYGDPGVHALQHVEQGQDPAQGTLLVGCLVQEMQMRLRAAKVSFGWKVILSGISILNSLLHIS